MRTLKQRKRLVHKHQYLRMLAEKSGLYSFSLFFGGTGIVCLLIAAFCFALVPDAWRNRADWDEPSYVGLLLFSGLFSLFCFGTMWGALTLFKAARAVEKVTPITPHNTGLLPEVETLVRSSERPAIDPQAVLLRAVSQSPQPPPEQLLRAANRVDKDI